MAKSVSPGSRKSPGAGTKRAKASRTTAATTNPHVAGRRRLAGLHFYPGGFVLDTTSGLFYRLSPAADYLLRLYDEGTEVRDFADIISSRYGLDHASAVRDVELLLNQFAAPGLLGQLHGKRRA